MAHNLVRPQARAQGREPLARFREPRLAVGAAPEEASRRLWERHMFGVLPLTAE